MESAEIVPAISAEVDIPSKSGTKRKRSCHSAAGNSKKPRQISKSNKENCGVQATSDNKKKSIRCLKKTEKQVIATAILNVDKSELVASVLEHVAKELHIRSFEDRSKFWEKLKVSNMLVQYVSR